VWLERMVQALMSCVTTGNVKVLQEIVLLRSLKLKLNAFLLMSAILISESFALVKKK